MGDPDSWDNFNCNEGRCNQQIGCICTREYNPVCCNGVDYINPCVASCRGNIIDPMDDCSAGTCDIQNQCLCSMEYEPICCENTDYANPCMAECDGIEVPATQYCFAGRCEDHEECVCTEEFDPWCCDKKYFRNACEAKCADFCNPKDDERCEKGIIYFYLYFIMVFLKYENMCF